MEEDRKKQVAASRRKRGLIVAGSILVIGVIVLLGLKRVNADSLRIRRHSAASSARPPALSAAMATPPSRCAFIPLTGRRKTATKLGEAVGESGRKVNDRLVKRGLATREPYGLKLTDSGRHFGEAVLKTTRSGHTFENIEWDEAVGEVIFTAEELADAERRRELAHAILKNARNDEAGGRYGGGMRV